MTEEELRLEAVKIAALVWAERDTHGDRVSTVLATAYQVKNYIQTGKMYP